MAALNLAGSTIVGFALSGNPIITGLLGKINFRTGALSLGSLASTAIFNGGGKFTIAGNGSNGIHAGTIFSGMFDGPVAWQIITLGNGTNEYKMTGTLIGTWFNGATVTGAFIGLTDNIGKSVFKNGQTVTLASLNVNLNGNLGKKGVVPEPSSLLFMGTGLSVLGFYARKYGIRR
jgi:hypothetical protein